MQFSVSRPSAECAAAKVKIARRRGVEASKEIFFSEQEAPSEQTFSTTHFCLFYVALSLVMNHGVLVLTHQRFM